LKVERIRCSQDCAGSVYQKSIKLMAATRS